MSSRSVQSTALVSWWSAADNFLDTHGANYASAFGAGGLSPVFARHPTKRVVYSVTANRLMAFNVDESNGEVTLLNSLDWDTSAPFGTDVLVHPNGKYLYVTAGRVLRSYEIAENGALAIWYIPTTMYELSAVAGMTMNFGAIKPNDTSVIYAWSTSGQLVMVGLNSTGNVSYVTPRTLSAHTQKIVFHPNGNYAVSTDGDQQKLTVWKVENKLLTKQADTLVYDGANPVDIAFSLNGGGALYTVAHSYTGPITSVYRRWGFGTTNGKLTDRGHFTRPGYGSIAGIHPHNDDLLLIENGVPLRIKDSSMTSTWNSNSPFPTGGLDYETSLFLY